MAQPSETTGAQQSKHAGDGFTIQHLCFGHPVLIQSGHERRSLGNADVHLCIKVQSAGDGGAKVGEVVHDLKGMTVDGDGWQGFGA